MQIISKESFQKIESLIPENHVNVHARLRQWLNEEESALFAYPDFPSANTGQWYCNINDALKSYADASPMEKEEVSICLENYKQTILSKLQSMSYASELFKVPSEKQILWYRDQNGQLKIILAQWGFKLITSAQQVDVIDYIIHMPRFFTQTDVNIHISYSDGQPAVNKTFSRFMFNNEQDFTTDEQGMYGFGKMFPNQKFSVSDKHGTTRQFVVEKDKNDYYAQFDFYTSCQVKVVNQFDEALPHYSISINQIPYTTDQGGCVTVDHVLMTPDTRIQVSCAERSPEEFVLSRDAEQNVFIYKIKIELHTSYTIKIVNQDRVAKPNYHLNVNGVNAVTDSAGIYSEQDCVFEEGKRLHVIAENGRAFDFDLSLAPSANNFLIEVKDDIYTSYTVKVTNQHGVAKSDFPISIDGQQYKTDQQGLVAVENVLWEEGKQIAVYADGGQEQRYGLQRDSSQNNYIYVVEDKQVRIRVLDYDGSPLDNVMVYVDTKKGVTLSAMSDAEGYALFPANAFENGKKAKVHFKIPKEYRKNREEKKKAQNQ